MIDEALLHCRGIGPARVQQLHDAGIRNWTDIVTSVAKLPVGLRAALVAESESCLNALQRRDIRYFVSRLHSKDKWRILTEFLEQVSFFDIETAGLEVDSPITVIVCWHRGRLHTFVEHENLDDFLRLLDEIDLLASFNGSSFDVPRVLDAFHIPDLPCPHLDLRWLCYHRGFQGGLKEISAQLGIARPSDLAFADGSLAVRLWSRWNCYQDQAARDLLLRYCGSDVLLLLLIAHRLADDPLDPATVWSSLPLPTTAASNPDSTEDQTQRQPNGVGFGAGSPQRLRGRRHGMNSTGGIAPRRNAN